MEGDGAFKRRGLAEGVKSPERHHSRLALVPNVSPSVPLPHILAAMMLSFNID